MPRKKKERTHLTTEEMIRFIQEDKDREIRSLKLVNLNLKKEMLLLQQKMLDLQKTVTLKDIQLMDIERLQLVQSDNQKKSDYQTFVRRLEEEFGVKSNKFGFDPITGEVDLSSKG